MNRNLLACFLLLILPFTSKGVEFELKQKVKSRASVLVSQIENDNAGNLVEQKDKRKNRKVYQARFVLKFDKIWGGFSPYAQLGYEKERKDVNQYVTTSNGVANESYEEYVTSQFIGVGLKYKFKEVLFAEQLKFDFRFDRWLDIEVERSKLGSDAEPLSGSFEGYEQKIKMEAMYATPRDNLKIQPHLYYAHFKQDAWQNQSKLNDLQVKEKGYDIEARLLVTWLPKKIDDLTLSLGPEIIIEEASEYQPDEGWVSEKDDVTLLTFLGTYELAQYNLEFELWLNHQLDGQLDGENNVEFKMDWRF